MALNFSGKDTIVDRWMVFMPLNAQILLRSMTITNAPLVTPERGDQPEASDVGEDREAGDVNDTPKGE